MSVAQADVVRRVEIVETAAIVKAAIGDVMLGRTRRGVRLASLLLVSVGVSDGVVVRLQLRKGLKRAILLANKRCVLKKKESCGWMVAYLGRVREIAGEAKGRKGVDDTTQDIEIFDIQKGNRLMSI